MYWPSFTVCNILLFVDCTARLVLARDLVQPPLTLYSRYIFECRDKPTSHCIANLYTYSNNDSSIRPFTMLTHHIFEWNSKLMWNQWLQPDVGGEDDGYRATMSVQISYTVWCRFVSAFQDVSTIQCSTYAHTMSNLVSCSLTTIPPFSLFIYYYMYEQRILWSLWWGCNTNRW